MSLSEKIAKLERLIRSNPSLAYVPFIEVRGTPITPAQALEYLKRGVMVAEILTSMRAMGYDDVWSLAESYYSELAKRYPNLVIYSLGTIGAVTVRDALQHIRARDEIGRLLVRQYQNLLMYMKKVLE